MIRPETGISAEASHQFRSVLGRIENLPTLPEVITRILDLVEDPDVSTHKVAEVVGQDQSIVSSILRMVNSPYYALSTRITSIQHAVVLLGLRTVRNIALSSVLVKTFGSSSDDGRFDRALLWKHTVACAIGARLLAQRLRSCDPEEAFLSGLIHDIGLVVLDQYFHEDFARVLDLTNQEGMTLCAAEQTVFGHDHAAAGALLARHWNFPASVVEAIGCHHQPSRAQRDPVLASLVHLANWLGNRPDLITVRDNPLAPNADEEQPRQIWESEPLDPFALEAARVGPEELADYRALFLVEWAKAQVFVRLRA